MWKLLLPLVLLMSGCAAQVKSSSDRSVVIWAPGNNVGDAQQLADVECGKRNLRARLAGQLIGANLVYDCVP